MNVTDYIENHPKIGAILTIGHLLIGRSVGDIDTYHLPPIFIECLQAGAYSISIIVGAFSVYGFVKKMKLK